MKIALTATLHDPSGGMLAQAHRTLPVLKNIFQSISIRATKSTSQALLDTFRDAGANVKDTPSGARDGQKLGLVRAEAVSMALDTAPYILYCDCDRALHWAEFYPEELARVAADVRNYDFTVLGRTPRAFQTHPAVQYETEQIINRVFHLVSGWNWDVGAASRGISRRAARAILAGCKDENLSTDVSWPLYLHSLGGFTLTYLATEGLEFETPDRFEDEVRAAGGTQEWLQAFDSDPRRWLERLDLAAGHLRAMLAFVPPSDSGE